jgi:hypothetical protein
MTGIQGKNRLTALLEEHITKSVLGYTVMLINITNKQLKNNRLRTKAYDKRDAFNFSVVNFPFICCNIPAAPA